MAGNLIPSRGWPEPPSSTLAPFSSSLNSSAAIGIAVLSALLVAACAVWAVWTARGVKDPEEGPKGREASKVLADSLRRRQLQELRGEKVSPVKEGSIF